MDKLLTMKDVAEYLQVSKDKIYKLAQQGKISVSRIENQWRFRLDNIDAWLETNKLGTISTVIQPITSQLASKAGPFLKWAGGKGQLLKQYEAFFPSKFNNYIEPFVGGGAVFFHLYNTVRVGNGKRAILIDSNEELINCYLTIKADVNRAIRVLSSPKFKNEEDVYYEIRSEEPTRRLERAARIIYLNRTCFNGLYRVNNQNKFNVPFGRYKNPMICNSKNLRAASSALKNVEILPGDFKRCLDFAKRNDFIYFDPPYQPLSSTSSFTSYTKSSFDEQDQEKLCEVFKKLDRRKCKAMLSNSDTPLIRKLYKDFKIEIVSARRAINCNGSGRGRIAELVILNY